MITFQANPANLALLILWTVLWVTGGCWIVRAAFNLRPNELFLTGFGAGWIIETLFANVLAAWLPLPLVSWLAALLVLLLGLAFSFTADKKLLVKIALSFWQVVVFLFLAYVFTAIARGLALFDDYAHLPTLSIMATGEIPPRFALDPSASYGYHYFLLLFSTELMHIGKLFPWEALDVGRGVSTALAILLSLVWVQRLTRSLLGGFLGALMVAFGTGTRWFLLFLPENLMRNVSSHLSLLGSGFNTSPSLYEAMVKPWALDGGGPFPFPFAYINGISTPGVLNLNNPNGLIGIVSGVILLLTFNRWKGWRGVLVSTLIFGTSGLLGEGAPASVGIFLIITVAWMLRKRSLHLPSSLWQWWIVIGVGTFLSVILGGVWTEILRDWLSSLAGAAAKTYQDISFVLTWSPTIVSSHLGVLELRNPYQLLVALAEIGPALLALPLVCIWAWKAFRAGRWYEVSVILFGLASLAALLVEFAGAHGVRNTTRLYGFIGICFTFGVPAVWMWVEKRAAALKILAALLGLVVIFGGLMTLAVELIAAPKPVYTTFLTDLDVQVMQAVWNRTDPGALVFDMDPFRGPTVLGRHTNSSITLYQSKPEWQALEKAPLPADLRRAGYSYVYMDDQSWWGLDRPFRDALSAPCVQLVDEASSGSAFRRLLDIRGCL